MAHPPEMRSNVRDAYISGLDLEMAAGKAGVPYPTARKWKSDAKAEGDDWDKSRNKSNVRAAYLSGLDLEAAAAKAGVPHTKALLWKSEELLEGQDWDKSRNLSLILAGGGMDNALARVMVNGLIKCEAIIDRVDEIQDPVDAVKALASLGDTVSKLKAYGRGLMKENDKLAIETETVKSMADLFIRLHPKMANEMLTTVEEWAHGQR